MIYIISGTNRKNARTRQVADYVLKLYKAITPEVALIDLSQLPLHELTGQYGGPLPTPIQAEIDKINGSDGIVVVTPEYNGSMPGTLKQFIDYWSYPKTFEYRPVAFIGLGFRWGGLRPVEHLQQIFNYRNAFVFPERVFMTNITDILVNGEVIDKNVETLLQKQTSGFVKFIAALKTQKLHPLQIEAVAKV
jgi:chromate reductase